MSDHERKWHACLAQDVRREIAFSKVFRERSPPSHRDPEIVLQRRAHHFGEEIWLLARRAATDQHRQSETPLLSRRLCEAFEGRWSNRVPLAVSEVGRKDDNRARRRIGGQTGYDIGESPDALEQVLGQDGRRD